MDEWHPQNFACSVTASPLQLISFVSLVSLMPWHRWILLNDICLDHRLWWVRLIKRKRENRNVNRCWIEMCKNGIVTFSAVAHGLMHSQTVPECFVSHTNVMSLYVIRSVTVKQTYDIRMCASKVANLFYRLFSVELSVYACTTKSQH